MLSMLESVSLSSQTVTCESQSGSVQSRSISSSNMPSSSKGIFSALRKLSKSSKSSSKSSSRTNSMSTSGTPSRNSSMPSTNPVQTTASSNFTSTESRGAPPAYSSVPSNGFQIDDSEDNRFAFLAKFDIVFVIDDSTSMIGSSWSQTRNALASITPVCTKYDSDGIDICFLNAPDRPEYHYVTMPSTVDDIFSRISPRGATPTGQKLHKIMKSYLAKYTRSEHIKPLNIIVITDGEATDDVDSTIISAAQKLDKLDAPPWQLGIQFFQVGNSIAAREYLKFLDDNLVDRSGNEIRDIVDTVPWSSGDGATLNAEGILKVVLGAVNRRLDRSGVNLYEIRY